MNRSFDTDGLQYAWDATSIKAAEECLRKYYYKHLCGWYSPNTSVHLRFGGIYASALESYEKARASGTLREDAILTAVHYALVESWDYAYSSQSHIGDPAYRIAGSGKAWETGDANKTRSSLIRTIVWYFEHFEEDLPTVIFPDGKPAIEYSFALPVSDTIVFCGHMDRIVEYGGQYMIMDQKTTKSTVGPYFFDQFSPDTQMSMYTYAGNIIFQHPVKGVLIDAAQIAIGFSRFERAPTFRTHAQLEEWYENAMMTIQVARDATKRQRFPMNTTACGNYGGCEFRSICSKSPEVREMYLKSNFVKKETWSPIERR